MRILIISAEVWRDSSNGGNILSNMFCDFKDTEFAQIYCSPGTPQNNICKKYFQMTDKMAIKNFFTHKPIGKSFILNTEEVDESKTIIDQPNKKFVRFFKKFNFEIFHLMRSLLWNLSNWKTKDLVNFVKDFNPDIIFAPCYAETYMLKMTRFVQKITNKKVISYISDDGYTLHQFNLSIFYWINRFAIRHQMRKTFKCYSLCYTMTEIQKKQCEKDFNANMKILLKPVEVDDNLTKNLVNNPIKFIYAGGIYLNRWKTLSCVVDALKVINRDGVKAILDIYTGNELTRKQNILLNDGINSNIHGLVTSDELRKIYENSDIALHIESFDLKNRLRVRMSFSTKITDCLTSGCATMAICDKKQGGFLFLKDNDIAICVSDKNKISEKVKEIVNNHYIILSYANKSLDFVKNIQNSKMIRQDIFEDFYKIIKE